MRIHLLLDMFVAELEEKNKCKGGSPCGLQLQLGAHNKLTRRIASLERCSCFNTPQEGAFKKLNAENLF